MNNASTPPAGSQVSLAYGAPVTLAEAKRVAQAAEDYARARGWPMAICIVDAAGHPVLLARMDDTQLGSIEIARLKAETSALFRRPTRTFEDNLARGGNGLRALSMPNVLALEGGLPILRDGKVIGAIGVSGMSSAQDVEAAQAGLAALDQA